MTIIADRVGRNGKSVIRPANGEKLLVTRRETNISVDDVFWLEPQHHR
jgi:hypothetical protein